MENYIDVLLKALGEYDREFLGWEYFVQSTRAAEAKEALERTLSNEQKKLLEDFEDKQAVAASAYEMALARQAFSLAREIYR